MSRTELKIKLREMMERHNRELNDLMNQWSAEQELIAIETIDAR